MRDVGGAVILAEAAMCYNHTCKHHTLKTPIRILRILSIRCYGSDVVDPIPHKIPFTY